MKTRFAEKLRKGQSLMRKSQLFSLCFPASRRDSARNRQGVQKSYQGFRKTTFRVFFVASVPPDL